MQETASTPISSNSTSVTESATPSTPLSPLGTVPPPSRLQRIVATVLAWPRAVLRHPLRSLTIAVLLALIGGTFGFAGVWLYASYHLRTGRAALEHYHTSEAVVHLQAAMSIWPRDPETLLLAARAARRSGAFDTADRLLDLYQEQRKDDEDLTIERICVRAERGEPASVTNFCRKLIERNDRAAPLVYEALAQGFARSYQPHDAAAAVEAWLQLEPDNPQALNIQGQISELLSRQSEAIQSYRAALTADPNFDEVRIRLCDALMRLGSVEECTPHLEWLHSRLPDNPKVDLYLARVQDRQGHSEEAERILDAVLARQPHYALALLDRGKMALRAGQFTEAEKYLREAVLQDPTDHQTQDRLAFCLEQNDRIAEAEKIREHMKEMEKDMEELHKIIIGERGRPPFDAELNYKIGMISLRAGNVPEGLRWLNNAIKEDPNHQAARKALMEHYKSIGDTSRAREHQQKLAK